MRLLLLALTASLLAASKADREDCEAFGEQVENRVRKLELQKLVVSSYREHSKLNYTVH